LNTKNKASNKYIKVSPAEGRVCVGWVGFYTTGQSGAVFSHLGSGGQGTALRLPSMTSGSFHRDLWIRARKKLGPSTEAALWPSNNWLLQPVPQKTRFGPELSFVRKT